MGTVLLIYRKNRPLYTEKFLHDEMQDMHEQDL